MNMISDFSTGSSQKESEPIEKRAEKVIEKITQQEKEIVPLLKKEQKRRRRNRKFLISAILIVCVLAFSATLYVNYNLAINHRSKSTEKVDFTVNPGDSIDVVAKNLAKDKLIISKNSLIFYARMNNKRNILAGKYQLSANMTIPEILEVLNKGQVNTSFNVTFLPGGTVKMAKATLSKIGYSNNEINQAFSKDYSSEFPKLFAGKDKNTDKLISLFWEKFLEYAFLNKIICSFVRFHPIEKNYEYCRDIMELERISSTVCIDLNSEEQIWSDISSKCRNIIRKAIKNNVMVIEDENLKKINDFQNLYYDTMKKNNADEYYFFKEEFFEQLKFLKEKEITHFYALHEDKIISSILVLMGDEYLHYYLSANSQEGYSLNANSLLLYEIAKYGLKRGYKYFHLGGGYGGDDSPLFKFKSSFHKNHTLSFYIGKKIFNQKIYDELCQKAGIDNRSLNYFPLYRYKK